MKISPGISVSNNPTITLEIDSQTQSGQVRKASTPYVHTLVLNALAFSVAGAPILNRKNADGNYYTVTFPDDFVYEINSTETLATIDGGSSEDGTSVGKVAKDPFVGYRADSAPYQIDTRLNVTIQVPPGMNIGTNSHARHVDPVQVINAFPDAGDAGADFITVHAEATKDACGLMNQIKELGVGAGIAVNPDTPSRQIEDAIPHADMALVMSVHAGFGGQSFIEPVLDKFDEIRSMPGGEDLILEIDGGINASTIGLATERGAQLLVAGSAIFKQDDYSVAMESMMAGVKYNQ